jgi:hypothetical protein
MFILCLIGVYSTWSASFVSSGLDNVECASKQEAMVMAFVSSTAYDGDSRVIHTSGVSNSFSGYHKKGYAVIRETSYDELKENDFALYRRKKKLILHRLRMRTKKGWIIEGDGNSAPDSTLVTRNNLIGTVLNKKVYRY